MTMCVLTPNTALEPGKLAGLMYFPLPDHTHYRHVAVAVIRNRYGDILIARRHDHLHQGGKWEFPGGKVEYHETVQTALQRELHEELGIEVHAAQPLIRIPHEYPDLSILLDVWSVERFSGEPFGREGQPVEWVTPTELSARQLPTASRSIVTAVRLPDTYLITPEPSAGDFDGFLDQLEIALADGIRLVQLRAKYLDRRSHAELARRAFALTQRYSAALLLNVAPAWLADAECDGLHLSSAHLAQCKVRPNSAEKWLAASCHTPDELEDALRIGVDFVVISPVLHTQTHPGAQTLGWEGFTTLVAQCRVPAYALGGMSLQDVGKARSQGGQGIAAIRAVWPN